MLLLLSKSQSLRWIVIWGQICHSNGMALLYIIIAVQDVLWCLLRYLFLHGQDGSCSHLKTKRFQGFFLF